MTNFYSEDLAYIHDTGFSNFAHHAAKMITDTLSKQSSKKGLVIDLGCGSGVVARALTDNQFNVLGIDRSESLIKIAKNRVPEATFVVGSFFETPFPPCTAIVSTSECFNYLPNEGENRNNLEKLFQCIFSAINKGGLFIFDMIEPGNRGDQNYIMEHNDWTMFVRIHEEVEKHKLIRDITLFRKTDKLYRKSKELHEVRLYPHDLIVSWLEKTGFKVSIFKKYNELSLDKHHYGFLCLKPG